MNDLKEKAAYLRGLVKGTDTQQDEKQRLIWEGLIDFCDSAAESLSELGDSQNEIADYVEAIDEDLNQLEKYFYSEGEENEDDVDVVFSKESDNSLMELNCPYCKEQIYFEDESGDYEVICPECGNVVWTHSSVGEANYVNKADVI